MTRKEALRQTEQARALVSLGFTHEEAEALRRISMQLHRWHELECGIENGGVERDEVTGKTYWYNAMTGKRSPYPDRETGARKRLEAIISERNKRAVVPGSSQTALGYYVQTDPRGAALYIIRPDDIPAGASVESYYTRGVVVY